MNISATTSDSKAENIGGPRPARGFAAAVPWLVLVGLVALGFAGGLGLIPKFSPERAVAASTESKPESNRGVVAPKAGAPAPGSGNTATDLPADFPVQMLARGVANPAGPKSIEARHLLVQYKGSWHAGPEIIRSKEDAFGLAEQALGKLKKGGDFEQVMNSYTDSADVKSRHGSFGVLDRDTTMRAIAAPAFALKIGEYSGVVESPFGFHVIQRTK